MPALDDLIEKILYRYQAAALGAYLPGGRRYHRQGTFAALDLLAQDAEFALYRFFQRRALQFPGEHRHGREGRAQFVCRTGGKRTERHQLLVPQCLFARLGERDVSLSQSACHAGNKPGNQRRAQDEAKPHAEHVLGEIDVMVQVVAAV